MGFAFGLFAGFLYAVSTVVAKMGVERNKAHVAVVYTLFMNNFLFIGIILLRSVFFDYEFVINWKAFGILALSGLFGPLVGRTFLFASSERIGASRASSIKILSPVFSAVIALIFLQEVLHFYGYMGILIVVVGLYWLYRDNEDSLDEGSLEDSSNMKKGTYLAFGCAFFYSLSYILRKSGISIYPYPLEAAAIEVFFGLLYYMIYFLATGKLTDIKFAPREKIKYFLISGTTASCALFSYYFALQFIPATVGATLSSTQAFFALLIGAVFTGVGERWSFKLAIGSILIIIGVSFTVMY